MFDPGLLALAEGGVLNPHGYTLDEAARTLNGLQQELGDGKYDLLEQLMTRHREILFRAVGADDARATPAELVLRHIPGVSALVKVSDRGLSEQR